MRVIVTSKPLPPDEKGRRLSRLAANLLAGPTTIQADGLPGGRFRIPVGKSLEGD